MHALTRVGWLKKKSAVKGERICPVRTFAYKGALQIWTSTLFGARNFGFFEIYRVSVWTREGETLSQCGQGRLGVNFSRFCTDPLNVFH